MSATCRSGYGCKEEVLQGGKFCGPHQAQLDRVKESMGEHDFKRSMNSLSSDLSEGIIE